MIQTHVAIRALRDLRLGIVSGRLVSTRLSSSGTKAPARLGLSFIDGILGPLCWCRVELVSSRLGHFDP